MEQSLSELDGAHLISGSNNPQLHGQGCTEINGEENSSLIYLG